MQGVHCAAVGRLAADADLKFTANGQAVMSFSLAVSGSKEGEETQWLRVSVWAELAEELHQHGRMVKGAEIYVAGKLKMASWTGSDGAEHHGLNVSAWECVPMGFGRKPQQGLDTRPMGQYPQRGRRNSYQGIKNSDGYRMPANDFEPAGPPTTNPWR